MYYCKYLVIKNKKVILDRAKDGITPCFADYNNGYGIDCGKDFGTRKVQIILEKEIIERCQNSAVCKYSLEELRKYCRILNSIGFKVKVMEKPDYFYFMVDEKNYKNKTHVRTALDLIRFTWEGGLYKVVDFVLDSKNKDFIKDVGIFEAMQLIASTSEGNHHRFASCSFGFITLKEFYDFLEANPKHREGNHALWTAINKKKKIGYDLRNLPFELEVKEKYKKFKNKPVKKKAVAKKKAVVEKSISERLVSELEPKKVVKKKKVGVAV